MTNHHFSMREHTSIFRTEVFALVQNDIDFKFKSTRLYIWFVLNCNKDTVFFFLKKSFVYILILFFKCCKEHQKEIQNANENICISTSGAVIH